MSKKICNIQQQIFYNLKRIAERGSKNSRKMDHVGQLQRRFIEYSTSLFREGFLDGQYTQLQQLQDESNPDFVVEVVSLFFDDSQKLLNDLSRALDEQDVDYRKVDACVHQLKGSSSSIGAHRVRDACIAFRDCCQAQNAERCLKSLQLVKQECSTMKNKLEALFMLEKQILTAGGAVPMVG